jgi:hypothetical protein
MSSEEEVRAKAIEIGKRYVGELRNISANLDKEQLRSEYKKMASKLEDEIFGLLKSQGIEDSYLQTSIGEEVFTGMFLKEYQTILKEKEAGSK